MESRAQLWKSVSLGDALGWLEQQKEREWEVAKTATGMQQRSDAMKQYQQWESAYNSLMRVMGYLMAGTPPEAPEAPQEAPGGVPGACFEEACPACGEPVERGTEGVVWVCPADREPGEPGWRPALLQVSREWMAQRNVWSNCGHEYGQACYPQVPLHPACHEKDFIVYASNPDNNRRVKR